MSRHAQAAGAAPIADEIVGQAAVWMARLWSDEASDDDRAACRQWRAAHPDHERAWTRLQAMEARLASVPRAVASHALGGQGAPASTPRRQALRMLAWATAIGAGAYAGRASEPWMALAADHATGTGAVRELALPDGTRIVLNSASAIDVHFDAHARRIVLRAGEIHVATAPDPAAQPRPFFVQDRHGTARALGTRYTVRLLADQTRVAVFDGAVDVRPRDGDAVQRVNAGRQTTFDAAAVQAPVAAPSSMAAWTDGMLVAENMRVADLLAELGRYRRGLLRCDADVAELRVTGVFPLRDTDRALLNLSAGLPVQVVYRSAYWVTVTAR